MKLELQVDINSEDTVYNKLWSEWPKFNKEIIPKSKQEGYQFKFKGRDIRITSSVNTKAKRSRDKTFCMLKVNECGPRMLCPEKVIFWRKNKDNSTQIQSKAILDNQKITVDNS